MNWIDYTILICLGVGLIHGFVQGLVRQVVGFGAMIVGFFAASWLNASLASYLQEWIPSRTACTVLAWGLIFGFVMALGSLIAGIIVRGFKLVGLSIIDRVMGAGFGFIQATLSLVICALCLMAFVPGKLPGAVNDSTLAPYVFGASKMVSAMTPVEIRRAVEKSYDSAREQMDKLRVTKKRLPAREE